MSALVDNDSAILGFGIDVQKPKGRDSLSCAFVVATLKLSMKIHYIDSYPISVCTEDEVNKPVFITAVNYDSTKKFSFGAVSGEL